MNLDLGSFAFGTYLNAGTGTPSWGTALGQSRPEYKFTYPGAEVILIGMIYCSVPLDRVSLPLGKGGRIYHASELDECQIASLFRKVYVNGTRIDYPFVMVLVKEDSESHSGRKSIKYSDKNVYQYNGEQYSNTEFVRHARIALGLKEDACWFIYSLEVYNQDELHMSAIIVDKDNSVEYENSSERRNSWLDLIDTEEGTSTYKERDHIDFYYPLQQIYYGAPGTGKSHRIKEIIQENGIDEKEQVFRTTFHPDSDYSTFVGCYKPIMKSIPQTYVVEGKEKPVIDIATGKQSEKEEIVYDYTPQAFIQAYTKAWTNPNKPVILVIEEINRGNCAQIFGDIFQLLDRGDDDSSDYEIKPDKALEDYLKGYFAKINDIEIPERIKSGEIMKLPSNLYIWATMNTSDQSLFPIDSAFKRRWDWVYMPIDTKKEIWHIKVGGALYSWTAFLEKINNEILTDETAEDKHLGFYFCKAENNEITQETFVGKVLFYLWNDVFKVYGIPAVIGSSKEWSYTKFYNTDGKVNEQKVKDLMAKLQIVPEGSNGNAEEEASEQ